MHVAIHHILFMPMKPRRTHRSEKSIETDVFITKAAAPCCDDLGSSVFLVRRLCSYLHSGTWKVGVLGFHVN